MATARQLIRGKARVTVRRGVREIDPAVADSANPTLRGRTEHFEVSYDPDLGDDGEALADAILGRCEADYATLVDHFGGTTPPNLPFQVLITTDSSGAYHYGCSGTEVFVGGRSASAPNADFAISLAVAEEVEVFEAALGAGWDCGASNGEGLSRVLANDLYPGVQPANFVSAPSWLDEPGRPDFVGRTDPTDRNYVSIGCSVLFLNWLRFQLNYPWQEIIAAGGPTLAEVYENLTGRADAFAAFRAQIDAAYPEGTPSNLTTDQPFPLPINGAGAGAGRGPRQNGRPPMPTMPADTLPISDAQKSTILKAADEVHRARATHAMSAGESYAGRATKPPGRDYDDELMQWHPLMRSVLKADAPPKPTPPPPAPPLPAQQGPFNSGSITFNNGVPVGGWSQLTLFQNGSFNFVGSFHDSGFPSYNDALVWGVIGHSGVLYTFSHAGHMAGTIQSGSRDDSWSIQGTSAAIAGGWADLAAGLRWRWEAHVNMDLGAVIDSIKAAISAAQTVAQVIAIV